MDDAECHLLHPVAGGICKHCGIYTAYRQTWNQFFILLVAEFICFILFFGATAITEGIGRFSEWLAEL